jgi:hypothetical protein
MTTKADCAKKIADYLDDRISHDDLVKWAWEALAEEDFPEADARPLFDVLMDVSASKSPAFAHSAEDYKSHLRRLGYRLESRLVSV